MDRFMFKIIMGYPSKTEEITILERFTEGVEITPKPVISGESILSLQKFIPRIYADQEIKNYVTTIVDATRNPDRYNLDLAHYITYGASPRASIFLILGAKAHALIRGRGFVIPEDIKAIAGEVLRHRIILTYQAEADGITTDEIISQVLQKVPVP
jgi:MoxR-like ATPase